MLQNAFYHPTNFRLSPSQTLHLDNVQGRQERLSLDYRCCHVYAVDEMVVLDKDSTVLDTTGVMVLVVLQQLDRTPRKKRERKIWRCGSGGEVFYDLSTADPEIEDEF